MILLAATVLAGDGAIEITNGDAPGEIFVDGEPTGISAPGRVRGLDLGVRHVTLTYGCLTGAARVEVLEGRVARFEIPLAEELGDGWLELADIPRGTRVELDGDQLTGQAQVPCGAHWLVVDSPGYDRYEQLVLVQAGRLEVVRPDLVRSNLDSSLDAPVPVPEREPIAWQRPAIAGGFAALAVGSATAALQWRAHADRAETTASALIDADPWDPAAELLYAVDVDPYQKRAAAGWVVTGVAATGIVASFVF